MTGRRERGQRGFTLIEIAVVLAIVGVLAAIASTSYEAYIERVRVLRAVIEIRNIATTLEGYLGEGGSLPPTLADAGLGAPKDPWGHPYRYLPLAGKKLPGGGGGGPPAQARKDRFLVPINTDFDLYSVGKDGKSVAALTAAASRDDVVRAANGAFIGLASKF
jgi:general secretion pathway protein G